MPEPPSPDSQNSADNAGGAECNISFCIQPQLPHYDRPQAHRIVCCVLDYIQSTGVRYYTGPSETTLEGRLDQLLAIVAKCQQVCIEAGATSAVSQLKIYYDPGKSLSFAERLRQTAQHRCA